MTVKLHWRLLLVLSVLSLSERGLCAEMTLIHSSRANAVRVVVPSMDSAGTGFFIDAQHVVTAFHVVGKVVGDKNKTPPEAHIILGKDVSVVLATGESIPAQIVAPTGIPDPLILVDPLPFAALPIFTDYAILKLQNKPKTDVKPDPMLRGKPLPEVGSEVVFSGYPLGAPTLLTHKGMISGITDGSIICIQGPINQGNSGGALLSDHGEIIGIITNREGGISHELLNLATYIDEQQKKGNAIQLNGVNPLIVIRELILTLNKYISPGIGYARPIKNVINYLDKNPEILK